MKTLIVYYSFTHNNEKLAKYLQKRLRCDIAKIETVKSRNGLSIMWDLLFKRKPEVKPISFQLSEYNHVIALAPIWAGKIAMPMKSFLLNQQSNIKDYSFVTLCGGGPGQKKKIETELVEILEKKPLHLIELWINDLLPSEKKDTVKYTSGYRITDSEFEKFAGQLRDLTKEENLVNSITVPSTVK